MDVLVARHQQEHGGAGSSERRIIEKRKRKRKKRIDWLPIEPLIYGGCILKIERDRENVSRAVKRRTLAGHG